MRRGSATIYTTLILAILFSLFLTIIEGAKNRAVSLRADGAFDLAVYSVFAEYNRALFDEYGLLFLDTSYGEQTASVWRVNRHLRYYMEENLDQNITGQKLVDFTKCYPQSTNITGISYATDEEGSVFQYQAIAYMKQAYGISYVEKLKKEIRYAEDNDLFTKDFSSQREACHEEIAQVEENGLETGEVDEDGNPIRKEVDIDNPADSMNVTRAKGILNLVTDETDEISTQSAALSECISYKKIPTQGEGLAEREKVSFAEQLLFDAYILEKCGHYRTPKKRGQLQYQTEYILAGKNNDMDNLKSVVHKLLLFREASNCVYLFSDAAKVSEAAVMATSICTAAGAPVLIEPVKLTLLFAWAYAEAIYDVKQLLAGGTVPIMKTAQTWHYSLSGILQAETEQIGEKNVSVIKNGLSYEDYLRMFLAVQPKKQKIFRTMDIVEMDVRKTSGIRSFHISNCADRLTMEATVESKYGYYRQLKRTYCYI